MFRIRKPPMDFHVFPQFLYTCSDTISEKATAHSFYMVLSCSGWYSVNASILYGLYDTSHAGPADIFIEILYCLY
jgi:hypothetical protein